MRHLPFAALITSFAALAACGQSSADREVYDTLTKILEEQSDLAPAEIIVVFPVDLSAEVCPHVSTEVLERIYASSKWKMFGHKVSRDFVPDGRGGVEIGSIQFSLEAHQKGYIVDSLNIVIRQTGACAAYFRRGK